MGGDVGIDVRRAGAQDADALSALRFRWRTIERGEFGLDDVSFARELSAWMDDHVDSHFAFLARRDGEPVGMAWLAIVERVPGPGRLQRRSGYVQSVYVTPPSRSSGIGHMLMQRLVDEAGELELDYLAVHPSDRSFDFYRSLGFSDSTRVLERRDEL